MKKFLKLAGKILLCVVVASALAFGSAYLRLGKIEARIHNGVWDADLDTGGTDAGLYQRAQIALYGLWALKASETIYFITKKDSDGNLLNRGCVYSVEGKDPNTRWWSLTVYSNYHFIDNPDNRYSYSKTTISREPDESWKIRVASQKQERNWLPMGEKGDDFELLLRVYNPSPEFMQNIATVPMPKVIKESCK